MYYIHYKALDNKTITNNELEKDLQEWYTHTL